VGAGIGGRGRRCPGEGAARCMQTAHGGNNGVTLWPEVAAPSEAFTVGEADGAVGRWASPLHGTGLR
jgi:hypothetical protein